MNKLWGRNASRGIWSLALAGCLLLGSVQAVSALASLHPQDENLLQVQAERIEQALTQTGSNGDAVAAAEYLALPENDPALQELYHAASTGTYLVEAVALPDGRQGVLRVDPAGQLTALFWNNSQETRPLDLEVLDSQGAALETTRLRHRQQIAAPAQMGESAVEVPGLEEVPVSGTPAAKQPMTLAPGQLVELQIAVEGEKTPPAPGGTPATENKDNSDVSSQPESSAAGESASSAPETSSSLPESKPESKSESQTESKPETPGGVQGQENLRLRLDFGGGEQPENLALTLYRTRDHSTWETQPLTWTGGSATLQLETPEAGYTYQLRPETAITQKESRWELDKVSLEDAAGVSGNYDPAAGTYSFARITGAETASGEITITYKAPEGNPEQTDTKEQEKQDEAAAAVGTGALTITVTVSDGSQVASVFKVTDAKGNTFYATVKGSGSTRILDVPAGACTVEEVPFASNYRASGPQSCTITSDGGAAAFTLRRIETGVETALDDNL